MAGPIEPKISDNDQKKVRPKCAPTQLSNSSFTPHPHLRSRHDKKIKGRNYTARSLSRSMSYYVRQDLDRLRHFRLFSCRSFGNNEEVILSPPITPRRRVVEEEPARRTDGRGRTYGRAGDGGHSPQVLRRWRRRGRGSLATAGSCCGLVEAVQL